MPMQISISNAIGGGGGALSSGGGSSFASTNSFTFDGNIDSIDCGDFSAYDNGDLSFSVWVYKTTSGLEYVFTNSGSGTLAGFDVVIWDKHIKIDRRTRTKQSSSAYNLLGLNYNTWHNIIGTYNDTTDELKVYFDGTFKATYSASSDVNSASIPLSIGSYAGTSNFFQGNIDEVSLFNTALTDGGVSVGQPAGGQIAQVYNSGVPNDISSFNPISWWRMGEEANYTGRNWDLIDQGSGGNNGFSDTLPPEALSTDVPT